MAEPKFHHNLQPLLGMYLALQAYVDTPTKDTKYDPYLAFMLNTTLNYTIEMLCEIMNIPPEQMEEQVAIAAARNALTDAAVNGEVTRTLQ